MTREEAIRRIWVHNRIHAMREPTAILITEALDMAIDALLGPQPDPITGLVPCGCGCKPELRAEEWGWYQVYCTGCDMHGGDSRIPDNVIDEWNTSHGYTAPPRPGEKE